MFTSGGGGAFWELLRSTWLEFGTQREFGIMLGDVLTSGGGHLGRTMCILVVNTVPFRIVQPGV
jgi:hypothetical protein